MERKVMYIIIGGLTILLIIVGGLLYTIQQDQQNIVTVATPTPSPLWTPTPTVATAAVIPTEQQASPVNNISYLYLYVLRYSGQGKGQTPVFSANHKWILHWQCYPGTRSFAFPIAVFESSGQGEAMSNIWDCKQGHSSGDSPVYDPGSYFATVTPAIATAHYDLFIEVYQ